jgi:tRNA(fMet)-specific endonuclease VapC
VSRLYLLDTNTASYIIKGISLAARHRLISLGSESVACLSAITEAELWFGLERVAANERRRAALRSFLGRMQVLPWGREEAVCYGSFRARQEANGKPLGPLDMQIAAHAIAVRAILVTHDLAFRSAVGLPGLEDWASDI